VDTEEDLRRGRKVARANIKAHCLAAGTRGRRLP